MIQEGKNDLHKKRSKKISCFEVLDVFFGGLEASHVA
jgi:hypothetical protein